MSSTNVGLNEQIAQAKQELQQATRARSESRTRTDLGSSHSKQPSNASNTIPEESGETANSNGRGTGITRVASPEAPGGARAAADNDSDDSDDDESDEESDNEAQKGKATVAAKAQGTSSGKVQLKAPAKVSSRDSTTQQTLNAVKGQAGSEGTSRAIENNKVLVMAANLDPSQANLLEELIEINGQDSYDALAAGIGKLKQSEYLLLPYGIKIANFAAEMVGQPGAHVHLTIKDWAGIYALNKTRAPDGANDKVFALLRMEAVKCGWVDVQREISYATPPKDAMKILATDLADLRDQASTIKTAAFLVPLVAEHVFRTYGHHYISTDAANYTERYLSTFRSCLVPEIATLLPPATLYHAALHWVSPARARAVLMAQLATMYLPDALKIRANAAPAGTAILTTTAAILSSMKSVGIDGLFKEHGNFDTSLIHDMTAKVKSSPCKYHKSYFAYGVSPPTTAEVEELSRAKDEGIRFAPYAQAYINAYMKDAALGKAQALKKHADQNPIQLRRAQTLFRELGRNKVSSIKELFITTLGQGGQQADDW